MNCLKKSWCTRPDGHEGGCQSYCAPEFFVTGASDPKNNGKWRVVNSWYVDSPTPVDHGVVLPPSPRYARGHIHIGDQHTIAEGPVDATAIGVHANPPPMSLGKPNFEKMYRDVKRIATEVVRKRQLEEIEKLASELVAAKFPCPPPAWDNHIRFFTPKTRLPDIDKEVKLDNRMSDEEFARVFGIDLTPPMLKPVDQTKRCHLMAGRDGDGNTVCCQEQEGHKSPCPAVVMGVNAVVAIEPGQVWEADDVPYEVVEKGPTSSQGNVYWRVRWKDWEGLIRTDNWAESSMRLRGTLVTNNKPQVDQGPDLKKFPHACGRCGSPAYVGFMSTECSRAGCK